jgi:hypothetical protein
VGLWGCGAIGGECVDVLMKIRYSVRLSTPFRLLNNA